MLVVGLGNPGTEYMQTRHNLGFDLVDDWAKSLQLSSPDEVPWMKKYQGLFAQGQQGDHKMHFLLPQTYMNRSGVSVQSVMAFYKLALNQVVVFHDDLDLPLGVVKVKQGGGHGGHNGLKSIDQSVGSRYWRVRLGIGRPERKTEVVSFVLSAFSEQERAKVQSLQNFLRSQHQNLTDFLLGRDKQPLYTALSEYNKSLEKASQLKIKTAEEQTAGK